MSFIEIDNSDHPHFDSAMGIYTYSFPSNERHPRHVIEDRLNSKRSRLFAGIEKDEAVMMCLLNNLSGGEFILFDYMAVSESHRGHGIGSLFMLFMHESLKTSGKYVVMEVERPGAGDNQNERKRRVAFCKKSGAQILQGVRYILPALDGTTPTEMILMVLPGYPKGVMERNKVAEVITKIYAEVYGRPSHDPLLKSFIDEIPETVFLN